MELKNTDIVDGSLHLNGRLAGRDDRYICDMYARPIDLSEFTMAMRFKVEECDPADRALLVAPSRRFSLHHSPNKNLFARLNADEYVRKLHAPELLPNVWCVVACGVSLNDDKMIIYVNNKKSAEFDIPPKFELDNWHSTTYWTFFDYGPFRPFHGLVDELIIYDRMLSEDEFEKIPLKP